MDIFQKARLQNLLSDIIHDQLSRSNKDHLRLLITIGTEDLSARDFSAYFAFIDKTYGRLHLKGLASYAQQHEKHIRVSLLLHSGSLVALFEEPIGHIDRASNLLLLYLALNYLPDLATTLTKSYQHIQKGHLAEAQAQAIQAILKTDPLLKGCSQIQLNLLAETLVSLSKREYKTLVKAARFAKGLIHHLELISSTAK